MQLMMVVSFASYPDPGITIVIVLANCA